VLLPGAETKVYFLLWINVIAMCTFSTKAPCPSSASIAQIGKTNFLPLWLSQAERSIVILIKPKILELLVELFRTV